MDIGEGRGTAAAKADGFCHKMHWAFFSGKVVAGDDKIGSSGTFRGERTRLGFRISDTGFRRVGMPSSYTCLPVDVDVNYTALGAGC